MDTILKNIERAKVIATQVVTYLVAASAALTYFANDIAASLPEGYESVSAFALKAAAVLTAAVLVIRRSTPVPSDERQILPN